MAISKLLINSFALLLLLPLTIAQVFPTDATFDCSNTNFRVIYSACTAQDYTKCCAVGTDCCAGGCCSLTSYCVGRGTSLEACCTVGDATQCGTGSALPLADVICDGSDGLSSYHCPYGSKCNINDDTCIAGAGGASATAQTSRQTQAAPSSAASSSEAAQPTTKVTSIQAVTSVVESVSNTKASTNAAASTTTNTQGGTASNTGGGASGSVVTVTASPSATSSSKSAAYRIVATFAVMFGTVVVLVVTLL